MDDCDRRRAPRVRTAPRQVRLTSTCDGFLLDLSEFGALVRLEQPPPGKCVLQLQWSPTEVLYCRSLVVWAAPIQGADPADGAGKTRLAGLEFRDLANRTTLRLRSLAASE